jgi:hypothetical protein
LILKNSNKFLVATASTNSLPLILRTPAHNLYPPQHAEKIQIVGAVLHRNPREALPLFFEPKAASRQIPRLCVKPPAACPFWVPSTRDAYIVRNHDVSTCGKLATEHVKSSSS